MLNVIFSSCFIQIRPEVPQKFETARGPKHLHTPTLDPMLGTGLDRFMMSN